MRGIVHTGRFATPMRGVVPAPTLLVLLLLVVVVVVVVVMVLRPTHPPMHALTVASFSM